MEHRKHEQITPTNLTRVISIGRQLTRQLQFPLKLRKGCSAARTLGSRDVVVISVTVDRAKDEVSYIVSPVVATGEISTVTMDDLE